MNTRLLMAGSAVVMALLGLAGSFGPDELLAAAGVTPTGDLKVLVQVAGALYLGFAMLNWMSKDSVIGGIYGRPTALANFLHFFAGGMALLKAVAGGQTSRALWLLAIVYALFAAGFGLVAFRPAQPRQETKAEHR
jgi:hypothetical protein